VIHNQSKAHVDLLLPHPLDQPIENGSRIKPASRDIVSGSTHAPFDLFGRDRREFRATPFRPKQSTIRQTRPPLDLDAPRFMPVGQKLPLYHVYTDSSIPTQSKNVDKECCEWVNETSKPLKKKKASAIACFMTGKCERCGILVPLTILPHRHKIWEGHHVRACRGKCEKCRDIGLTCDVNTKHGAHPRCTNCAIEGAKCSGLVTHVDEDVTMGTCSRCGSRNIHQEDVHKRKCGGRCQPCNDRKATL
jgi:hypothetical protein